jgi:hypothetical protein
MSTRRNDSLVPPGERLRVWCLLRDQQAYVAPVVQHFGPAAEFILDTAWEPQALLDARVDLVLCVNDWPAAVARCLDAARQSGVPTLVLQDGVLDWRCQYENPLFGSGGGPPQHQPVLADKIACLGPASARHIASWGNGHRVEVAGMPRLDALATAALPAPSSPGRRLLVMTAKKPWFDDRQMEVILRSLSDVRDFLCRRPDISVTWRLTRNVAELLGVANTLKELSTGDLTQALAACDAVITTPSTSLLESMLAGRPVAALDYHNTPRFAPTAWTIGAPDHIPGIVEELLNPPASKVLFQQHCLRDNLRCDGPSAPRVASLIGKMCNEGRRARAKRAELRLGSNLLEYREAFEASEIPGLSQLYPNQPVFREADPNVLRVRLARLEKENERLKRETVPGRIFGRVRKEVARFGRRQ